MPFTIHPRELKSPVSLTAHTATLPLAEVADNRDHGTTAPDCINLLNMPLAENLLTGNAIYRNPLAMIEILRTFYSLDLILSVLSILSDRSRY